MILFFGLKEEAGVSKVRFGILFFGLKEVGVNKVRFGILFFGVERSRASVVCVHAYMCLHISFLLDVRARVLLLNPQP